MYSMRVHHYFTYGGRIWTYTNAKLSQPRKPRREEREKLKLRQLNAKLSQPRKQRRGEREKLRLRQLNAKLS